MMIELTEKELIVLASMFGENIIYGFAEVKFENLINEVSGIIESLQWKKLIDVDYSGYAHMPSNLFNLIEAICYPDVCLMVETQGILQLYYRKKENIFQVIKKNEIYQCSYYESIKKSFTSFKETYRLGAETVSKVKIYYENFDLKKALSILNQNEWLLKVINREDNPIYVTYLEWNKQELTKEIVLRFGIKENSIYECKLEEDGSLLILDGEQSLNETMKKMFERRIT